MYIGVCSRLLFCLFRGGKVIQDVGNQEIRVQKSGLVRVDASYVCICEPVGRAVVVDIAIYHRVPTYFHRI